MTRRARAPHRRPRDPDLADSTRPTSTSAHPHGRRPPGASVERHARGTTLLELLIVLTLIGLLLGAAGVGIAAHRDATALSRSARAVRGLLASARRAAVTRRAVVRVQVGPDGTLAAVTPEGSRVAAVPLGRGELELDSVRVSPRTLRFNPRGQAAPGSIYLYRGDRRVRIVCNFLGRLREEWSDG